MDILGDVMPEGFDPESPGSQTEDEGGVASEGRLPAELDPEPFREGHFGVHGGY